MTASGDYSSKLWNALDGTVISTWTHPHCVKCVDWFETGGVSKALATEGWTAPDTDGFHSCTQHAREGGWRVNPQTVGASNAKHLTR